MALYDWKSGILAGKSGILAGRFALTAACLLICVGCSEQPKACVSPSQCPVNTSCIGGFCQHAPFSDAAISNGEIVELDPDVVTVECAAKHGGPGPRAEASGAVISGEIHALGGEAGITGRCGGKLDVQQDYWVHTRCQGWAKREDGDPPPIRSGAATTVDRVTGKVYLYGGRHRAKDGTSWLPQRDLRSYERSSQTWKAIAISGGKAVAHAGLALDRTRDRLFLIGGDTSLHSHTITPVSTVMVFDLKTKSWQLSTAFGAPPARSRHHTLVNDEGTHLYVYGGLLANGTIDPQLWRLDLEKNKWQLVATAGQAPTGRAGAVLALVPGQRRFLLFGGADQTPIGFRNDVWQLDIDKLRWDRVYDGDLGTDGKYGGKLDVGDGVNCNSGKPAGGLPATFMQPAFSGPQRRAYAIGGWDVARSAMVIYGGRGECGTLADAWRFNIVTATWAAIDTTASRWSCPRKNPVKPGGASPCKFLCDP